MPRFTFVTFEQGLRTDSAVTGTVVVMLRRYPDPIAEGCHLIAVTPDSLSLSSEETNWPVHYQ